MIAEHSRVSSRGQMNCRDDYDLSRHVSDDGCLKTNEIFVDNRVQLRNAVEISNELVVVVILIGLNLIGRLYRRQSY